MLEKSKQLHLGADRDLVQAMKTTQEAVTRAKAFNDKWQDLHTTVLLVLQFLMEDGDESQLMVYLVKKILERANAYARSSVRDTVVHVVLATRLVKPGVDLAPIGEFQSSWYSTKEYAKAKQATVPVVDHFMEQLYLSND